MRRTAGRPAHLGEAQREKLESDEQAAPSCNPPRAGSEKPAPRGAVRGLIHRPPMVALAANRVSKYSQGPRWQPNEFRSNDLRTKLPPIPARREILLLKQRNEQGAPLLKPHIPPGKGQRPREGHFNYSETHLPAHAPKKTTPKHVSLPKGPGIDHTPCPALPGKVVVHAGRPTSETTAGE